MDNLQKPTTTVISLATGIDDKDIFLNLSVVSTVISTAIILLFILHGISEGLRVEWFSGSLKFIYLFFASVILEIIFRYVGIYRYDALRVPIVYFRLLLIGMVISAFCTVATYSAAWGNPHFIYTHNYFIHIDKTIFGFNWIKTDLWILKHPSLTLFFKISYSMISILYVFIIGFFIAENRIDIAYKFFMFQIITLAITITVFYFFPALGPAVAMKKTTSSLVYTHSYFAALHKTGVFTLGLGSLDGLNKVFNKQGLYYMTGIISFPSYHAVCIVAYMYFSKYLNKVIAFFIRVVSFFMLVSAIPIGNHCVTDILGGVIVAVMGIFLVFSKKMRHSGVYI